MFQFPFVPGPMSKAIYYRRTLVTSSKKFLFNANKPGMVLQAKFRALQTTSRKILLLLWLLLLNFEIAHYSVPSSIISIGCVLCVRKFCCLLISHKTREKRQRDHLVLVCKESLCCSDIVCFINVNICKIDYVKRKPSQSSQ